MDRIERLLRDAELRRKRLTQMYKDAEAAAVLLLAAALLAPHPEKALVSARATVRKAMAKVEQEARNWCDDSLTTLYARGMMDACEESEKPHPESSPLHLAIVAALAVATMEKLQSVSAAVDRNIGTLISSAQVGVASAGFKNATDWQPLAEQLRENLTANGVTGFIDKAGHSWKVDTYVDVVAQSSVMKAYRAGVLAEAQAQGLDLARLTGGVQENTCAACEWWNDTVVSITGATPGFPTIQDAEDAGVFHVHCIHIPEVLTAEQAVQEIADNGNSDPEAKEA